jgi:hypothetical protein
MHCGFLSSLGNNKGPGSQLDTLRRVKFSSFCRERITVTHAGFWENDGWDDLIHALSPVSVSTTLNIRKRPSIVALFRSLALCMSTCLAASDALLKTAQRDLQDLILLRQCRRVPHGVVV